jgi:hypothetical protein
MCYRAPNATPFLLGNEVQPFCSASAMKTVDGERATVAWFGRCLVMVRVVSDIALAPGLL